MIKMKNKFQKGFSMEELIVVCAIIGIMTAAVLVSMRGSKDARAVETSAREVAAAIREAQNYALTGKGANSTCRYNFYCTQDGVNYNIGGGCVSANYTLKNNVKFKFDINSNCNDGTSEVFSFTLPRAETSFSGSKKIILVDQNNLNPYVVCINAQGKVWEKSGDGC